MTSTVVIRGVYAADGSALVVVGQPAVMLLQLTEPDPPGPDVPQDLTGRAFVQRILAGDSSVLLTVDGVLLESGQIRFTIDVDQVAALLVSPATAIDLTHAIVELVVDGDDPILMRPFSVRMPTVQSPSALFTVDNDSASPNMVIRYVGAPGTPGTGGSAAYVDDTTPALGATTLQTAIAAVANRLNIGLLDAALELRPSLATGTRHLATGATALVLSESVSVAGVFTLWRGGVLQAPSGYTVNSAGSATITVPLVGDDGSGGESFEWLHDGVDPKTIAAARAALGL
jgi:hypothetical protein